jgi:hypothetical protein
MAATALVTPGLRDQPRESEEHVGDAHQQPVPQAARIARHAAHCEAHRGDHHDHGHDHPERDAAAVKQPGEYVAAEFVGAEPVLRGRPGQALAQVLRAGVERGEHRGQDRDDDQEQRDQQTGHRQRVAAELQP